MRRYVKYSDMVLDLDELAGAVQKALDLAEIAAFEQQVQSGNLSVQPLVP